MLVVIPFAAPLSEAGRAALQSTTWPGLGRLLAGRRPTLDPGDELSLSPPHERALARAWGWSGGDGQLPFAAQAARADGIDTGDLAWGLLTPAHWHLGTEQLGMTDPAALQLAEAESRALFDAVAPLFTSEGFVARWGAPLRWYVAHESLSGLAAASVDRVIGRNVDPWLPGSAAPRLLRRLLHEVQMQLHALPLNATRESRGLLPVNAAWLSGCGVAQPAGGAVRVDDRLRRSALAEDWSAWGTSWALLDAELAADPPARLVLCGERASATFDIGPGGWLQRLRGAVAPADLRVQLEGL
ncbi:MAG: hypothetical protein U1F56_11800 [Rubrivivax sp.]